MTTQNIKLKIHDESEFFSALDPDQNMLSEEIIAYFTRVFLNKHRRLREKYVIHIISDTPLNEEHVKGALMKECAQQKDDLHFAIRKLM